MKLLDGLELAGFIKERQARQVRALRQDWKLAPRLAIVSSAQSPVIDLYVRLKQSYGADIEVEVTVHRVAQADVAATIAQLNNDASVHGIIVQLPLADMTQADEVLALIAPEKDVDGLSGKATLTPATPLAIDWLLAGYNIDLAGKEIALVGNGRLVGAPLAQLWRANGLHVMVYDETTEDLTAALQSADVIVSATGVPGLILSRMVKRGAVVVDAGTASEKGKIVGDASEKLRRREDLTITPERGGVGPLTVAALFDNVIQAARATTKD